MNDFVYNLAQKFAPTYWASSEENCYLVELEPENSEPRIFRAYPPWNPFVYFSALQLNCCEDRTAYEITYFTIWDRDTGIKGGIGNHDWDTERTAILVTGAKDGDIDAFSAKEAYYAAHEGVSLFDNSDFCSCPHGCGVTIYWSEGKHASYPNDPRQYLFEKFNPPGFESYPGKYTLVDMGTLDNPHFPWVCHTPDWGKDKVGSIFEKLKTRLWKKTTWEKIKKRYYTEEKHQLYQEYEDIHAAGGDTEALTLATMKKVRDERPDPHLIRNINKFSKKDYVAIRDSEIKGTDIDYIAKANLATSEIERITQKNLHGEALRKYVRGD